MRHGRPATHAIISQTVKCFVKHFSCGWAEHELERCGLRQFRKVADGAADLSEMIVCFRRVMRLS